MPSTRPVYADLFDMPAGLRAFVMSKEFNDADTTLQKKYNLTSPQVIAMGDDVMAAIENDENVSEMVASVRASVVPSPVSEAQWKDFLSDMLQLEIWPLRELFGLELTSLLNDQQIATATWPQFRVLFRPLTYSGAASEVAALVGVSLINPHQRERLRDLIMSRAKGIRVDAQIRDALLRPIDFGGLGLSQEMADKTIRAMNDLISQVQVMSEDEYANFLAEESHKKIEATAKKAESASSEDPEITAIRAKMVSPTVPQSVLEESVEKTVMSLSNLPTDPHLTSRLRHIVSSRFRDIRSAFEMRQMLTRDVGVGGMGFDEAISAQIAEAVEQSLYHLSRSNHGG